MLQNITKLNKNTLQFNVNNQIYNHEKTINYLLILET